MKKDIELIGCVKCCSCDKKCTLEQLLKKDAGKLILFGSCVDCRLKDKTIEHKTCKRCKQSKLQTEFYKLEHARTSNCIECYKQEYRLKHPKKKRKEYTAKRNALINKTQFTFSDEKEYVREYAKLYRKLKAKPKQKRDVLIDRMDLVYTNKKEYFREYYRKYHKLPENIQRIKFKRDLKNQSEKTIDSKKPLINCLTVKKEYQLTHNIPQPRWSQTQIVPLSE